MDKLKPNEDAVATIKKELAIHDRETLLVLAATYKAAFDDMVKQRDAALARADDVKGVDLEIGGRAIMGEFMDHGTEWEDLTEGVQRGFMSQSQACAEAWGLKIKGEA